MIRGEGRRAPVARHADHRQAERFAIINGLLVRSAHEAGDGLRGRGVRRILGGDGQLVVRSIRRQGHVGPGYEGQRVGFRVRRNGGRADEDIAEGVLVHFRAHGDAVQLALVALRHQAVVGSRCEGIGRVRVHVADKLVLRAGVDEFVGPVRGQRPGGDGGPTVLDGLRARAVDVEGRVGGAVGYGELHKDAGPGSQRESRQRNGFCGGGGSRRAGCVVMDVRRAVEGHASDGAFRGEAGGGLGVARGDQGRDGRCDGRFQRVQIGIVTDARRVAFGDELGEPGGDEGRLAQGHVLQLASGDPRLMPPEALHVVLVILQRHDVAAGYGPLWAKRKNFIDNGCGHDELLFRPPCPPMPPFPTLNKFLRSAPLLLLPRLPAPPDKQKGHGGRPSVRHAPFRLSPP